MNRHHVTGGFMQSLLLAGPGVIIGAFLMASFVMYVLPLNWSWSLALVFGAITSATDTVAVVAVMKNAGASAKLTILIIGESLLNDGCAMVMFALFLNLLRGESYDFGGVILYFVKIISASVLIGIGFGLVSVWLLSRANRSLTKDDTTIQIAITFCTAYLVFFVAEYECEVSGVLACCVAGYMLAWKAPPLILEPETMHHVWGMIEWAANTIIFMLAGLIIGKEAVNNVNAMDWLYLIVLYIVLILIRAIVVLVLYPFLSNIGLKCTWRDAVFISWAGLRGALAVSLALIVYHDKEADVSRTDGHRVLFFVGGIAALTFFINAVFASNVLDYLGLLTTETSPDKILVLKQVQKRLRKKSFDLVMQLAKEMRIQDAATVVKHNSLLKSYIKSAGDREPKVTESMRSVSYGSQVSDKVSFKKRAYFNHYGFETADPKTLKSPLTDGLGARAMSRASDWLLTMRRGSTEPVMSGLQAYVRTVFLEIVRVHYWKCIEGGKLPRESYATQTLLYSIEKTLDKVTEVH
jgi:NhaP-type Na+/H+ or K+/H+ antiporter